MDRLGTAEVARHDVLGEAFDDVLPLRRHDQPAVEIGDHVYPYTIVRCPAVLGGQ